MVGKVSALVIGHTPNTAHGSLTVDQLLRFDVVDARRARDLQQLVLVHVAVQRGNAAQLHAEQLEQLVRIASIQPAQMHHISSFWNRSQPEPPPTHTLTC